ncbi:MAG: CDP-alcohol phosphatidyltransferase family protein [Sphingopyxis sp.]
MTDKPVQPIERIQRNLLAVAERRLLTWIAARLPASVTPDKLTALGFAGTIAIGAGYTLSQWNSAWLWLAIASYFINWFGDSLDGSLARYRQIERPNYGYFIDHSADALGNFFIVGGIGLSPYVRLDIALFALGAYLLLSIHTFLSARVTGQFNLTYLAGGPTELRLVLIAMSLAMLAVGTGRINGMPFTPFDLFVGGFAALLVLVFIVQTTLLGAKLRKLGK